MELSPGVKESEVSIECGEVTLEMALERYDQTLNRRRWEEKIRARGILKAFHCEK